MPIFDQDQLMNSVTAEGAEPIEVPAEEAQPEAPGFFETVGAAFGQENTVVNVTREVFDETADTSASNIDFRPFDNDGEKIQGYEDFADRFIGANSDKDIDLIKRDIDREQENRKILDAAPTWQSIVGHLAAGVADPLTLVPVVKTISLGTKAGRIAQGAVQGTLLGGAAGLSREVALQQMQETRTTSESVINVLSESAFGGILGAAAGAISSTQRASARMVLGKAMQGEDFQMKIGDDGVPFVERSVGAAESTSKLEDEGLAYLNSKLAKGVAGLGIDAITSPTLRGVTSEFGTLRQFTNKMFTHNFILGKETKGISRGDVAENLIRRDDARLTGINDEINKLYLEHAETGALRAAVATPKGKLTFNEFNARVSRILRDDTIADDLPQVNKAAKLYRAELDSLAGEMQKLKLLPDDLDPKTARNYLSRIYDTRKMNDVAVRDSFMKKVSNWMRTHNADGSLRETPLDEVDALEAAQDTFDTIMGQGDSALAFNDVPEQIMSKGRFTKERTFMMPDNELEEFLVNDAQQIVTNYSRRANSLIRVTKALNEMGYESLQDLRVAMKGEKDRILAGITDTKKRIKLEEKFRKDTDLLNDMFRMMTGSLHKPGAADRFVSTLMQYQFVRLLGGVSISSFPELGMAPLRKGFLNTLKDGYLPMIRDFKAAKLSKDQLRSLDIGLEHETSNILRIMSDTGVEAGKRQTEYDRIMSSITDKFGKATGLTYYTSFGRRIAASVSMADTVRLLKKSTTKGLSQKEITNLANWGISQHQYGKVLAMVDKYGQERGGSFISNHHLWSDQEAATIFRNAIQNQVEGIILKPSKGDVPIFAQKSNIGKLAFQFKSFMSSATNRITIRGLQDRDARTLAGMMYLASLGVLSGMVKDKIAGREISDDPAELLADGISRSGMMGLIGTAALDTTLSMYNPKSRRYAGKFVQGNVIGPTFGQIQDSVDTLGRLTDGNITDKDKEAAWRMVPFNNLFYLQILGEQAFGDDK